MSFPGIGAIAESLRKGTVQILATNGHGSGSGFVTGPGSALTNAHVVQDSTVRVQTWSGELLEGTVERRDERRDLALVRVSGLNASPITLRDSGTVRTGEIVVAVGNPHGFVGALSTGVVWALGPVPGLGRRNWIQANVRLAPGNSGGPLADSRGRVIGINTMIWNGLGLAAPAAAIQAFLAGRNPFRLGVTVRPVRQGLMILELEAGGAGERASLLPGDIIVGLDERAVNDVNDMTDALQAAKGRVLVRFLRGGVERVRQTVAATAQAAAEQAA